MMGAPHPRFNLYGCPGSYFQLAQDIAFGWLNREDRVEDMERALAEFVGTRFAVAMPQDRVGVHLVIKALTRDRKKVILSPYTIYDVVNMVIAAGAQPVFADIRSETCNLDQQSVRELVDEETGAILATHMHGLVSDMDEILEIGKSMDIPVIEDAAQAFGASYQKTRAGAIGHAGIFSFGIAKNLNTFFGGAVVTDDEALYRDLKRDIENFPQESLSKLIKRALFCLAGDVATHPLSYSLFTYWLFRYSLLKGVSAVNNVLRGEGAAKICPELPEPYQRKMRSAQARLALTQLPNVDLQTKARIAKSALYYKGLKDIPGVLLPDMDLEGSHIYLNYAVQVPDRWALVRYIFENKGDLMVQHIGNTADQECFSAYFNDCPRARETAKSVFLLPTYPSYPDKDVHRNIDLIRKFFSIR